MKGSFVLVTILAAVFVQASAHVDHGSEPHYSKTGEHNAEHDQEAILGKGYGCNFHDIVTRSIIVRPTIETI